MKYGLTAVLFYAYSLALIGQRVIAVQNPLFHRDQLWYSCNFSQLRSTAKAEILAAKESEEKSATIQKYEKQFLNIVDFSSAAFEGISQKLVKPITKHRNYSFSFSASRDTGYVAKRDTSNAKKRALKLYIFGGHANCGFGELLAAPLSIYNHEWAKYSMTLRANKDWSHMIIYAAYDDLQTDSISNASQSFLLFKPDGAPIPTVFRARSFKKDYDPGVFNADAFSKLSFGGILMMYEVSPKVINIFDQKGEIMRLDSIRKDLDHNLGLDTILNRFRGIDYLFLVMNESKYRAKRLNLISYLKTKYPWILPYSEITRFSTILHEKKKRPSLKNLAAHKAELGDLLIVEQVNSVKGR